MQKEGSARQRPFLLSPAAARVALGGTLLALVGLATLSEWLPGVALVERVLADLKGA